MLFDKSSVPVALLSPESSKVLKLVRGFTISPILVLRAVLSVAFIFRVFSLV
jgi:hypothetical protein